MIAPVAPLGEMARQRLPQETPGQRGFKEKLMMKKSTIVVIAVIAALAIGVAVLAVLNGRDAAGKKQLREDAVFVIVAGDVEYRVTMEDFLSLEQREFEAIYKKSGKDPETRYFTGAPFAELLQLKGIDPAGFTVAAFGAADGYTSAITMEDALDAARCFIAADDGADGPFRMILPLDQFSQRWCKLLTDVTLK